MTEKELLKAIKKLLEDTPHLVKGTPWPTVQYVEKAIYEVINLIKEEESKWA